MDAFEQALRAFCSDAVHPEKFVTEEGEPAERYIRLHSGRTLNGSRKFTDRMPITIGEDPEELADRIVARCASKRQDDNCYALLFRKGANNYKDAAELPKIHAQPDPGTTLATVMTKDGPMIVMERDPIAQLTSAAAAAVTAAMDRVNETSQLMGSEMQASRRNERRLTERVAKLEAALWVHQQLAPEEVSDNPMIAALMSGLGRLEGPAKELMALVSVVAQKQAGIDNPATEKERARRGTPDPSEAAAPEDGDTIDAEYSAADGDAEELTDAEFTAELLQAIEDTSAMALLRPQLVTIPVAMKLLPVIEAAHLPIQQFCPACRARAREGEQGS